MFAALEGGDEGDDVIGLGAAQGFVLAAELGLLALEADEPVEPVEPHALRAAARVMAMTARALVWARFFIENSLWTTVGLWFWIY
ncbi:hypothetical protein [Actinomyces mediterranea]|uniref:hypothetical protein n=1 Tax=Actinomyces mediterranea TaxID=1871028 RepID=UPI000970D1B0|nr:hypothetical protein [Actinomyces mediterranea]